jgi:hypothetical protein
MSTSLLRVHVKMADDYSDNNIETTGFPPRRPGFKPGSSHVRFEVDKEALGQVLSEYFTFPADLHSTNFSTITITYHLGLVQKGQLWPQYQETQSHPTNNKKTN